MKKKLLSLIAFAMCIGTMGAIAQVCTPDPGCTGAGGRICPDTIVNLPHSTVGQAYSTTVTVKVPSDTFGFPVMNFTLDSVTGLPTGFAYQCEPSNCVFPGGQTTCILITGTAPNAGMIGTYPLGIHVTATVNASGFPFSQPGTVDGYKIVIEDNTIGMEVINENVFEMAKNVPNPASNVTKIRFTNPKNEKIELNIYNTMGQKVYHQNIDAERGLNEVPVSVAEFADGMYIYTVSNGKQVLNNRMVVSKK